MKISRNWLQTFFDAPLPEAQRLADALTFHAFEIESVEQVGNDDVLDVKVTPNRGHDCLSHRGIAKELSAILGVPMKIDLLRESVSLEPKYSDISIYIEDAKFCLRFTGALIRGIRVGPTPDWLRQRLEAVGQRSINNVVDATNYIMLDIGQPLHAFDRSKIKGQKLEVKKIQKTEKFTALDDKVYELPAGTLVIADAERTLSIAGIKGGKASGVTEATADIFLEAANWDGATIRKASQALRLRTDASDRFQQVISPELAAYGVLAAARLIVEIAGGEIDGFLDEYPLARPPSTVRATTVRINAMLGSELKDADVADALRRLDLPFKEREGEFAVSVPFERLDLVIPEDLVEEIGRIEGYEKIPAVELPPFPKQPEVNPAFLAAETKREELMSAGYSEVFTSVFAERGEQAVLNKVGGERPFLRTTLTSGLAEALERNVHSKHLLGLKEVKLFEIGTVWKGGKEITMVGTVSEKEQATEEPLRPLSGDSYGALPISQAERYQPFSKFPWIVRDISMWVPDNTDSFTAVVAIFAERSRGLLRHVELFDQFKKGERVSYAFRLVFQSFEKTLTDEEANEIMSGIQDALRERGFEIR